MSGDATVDEERRELTTRERQNANLKRWPKGYTPATSRFGDPSTYKQRCEATSRRTGEPCRLPALRGATRCAKHGGYRQVPDRRPKHAKAMHRTFAEARRALSAEDPPRELVETPAWQLACLHDRTGTNLVLRYWLLTAWKQYQDGDPRAWHETVAKIEALPRKVTSTRLAKDGWFGPVD